MLFGCFSLSASSIRAELGKPYIALLYVAISIISLISLIKVNTRRFMKNFVVRQVGVDYGELQAALDVVPRALAQYR